MSLQYLYISKDKNSFQADSNLPILLPNFPIPLSCLIFLLSTYLCLTYYMFYLFICLAFQSNTSSNVIFEQM